MRRSAVFLLLLLLQAVPARAQTVRTFFVIHCDPQDGNLYPRLVHHYTNYPPDSILAQGWPLSDLEGTMDDFRSMLESAAGDEPLLAYGGPGDSDPHPEVDWLPGLPFRTHGGRDPEDAFSSPSAVAVGPYNACQITYSFIDGQPAVDQIKTLYAATPNPDVVGVVTHVFNFAANPSFMADWMQFVQSTDRRTVSGILEESDCYAALAVVEGRPAPPEERYLAPLPGLVSDRVVWEFSLPAALPVRLSVVDVAGRRLAVLADGRFEAGRHQGIWSPGAGGRPLPGGVYHLRLRAGDHVEALKFVVLR